MGTDHARLGASSSNIWLNCTKAPEMWGDRERKATIYTAEGTAAHYFAEWVLTGGGGIGPSDTINIDGFDIELDAELQQHAYVFTDECQKLAEGADWAAIEKRVNLDDLWPGGMPPEPIFGTLDFAAVRGDTAYLRDLKYGKGVGVNVYGNTQLMMYGVGLLLELPEKFRKQIKNMDLGIVQPRHDHPDGPIRSLVISVPDLKAWAKGVLRETIDNIAAGKTEFKSGKHCRWCVAAGYCSHLAGEAQVAARSAFSDDPPVLPPPPGQLNNAELADILEHMTMLSDWIGKVQSEAMHRIDDGQEIPGWKLVAKRAIRKWTDDKKMIEKLVAEGCDPQDLVTMKPKSPAAIEKLLKSTPEKFDTVKGLIDATSSGNTLAHDNDLREASPPRLTAKQAFKPVDKSALAEL
jgi:hypothetical protein